MLRGKGGLPAASGGGRRPPLTRLPLPQLKVFPKRDRQQRQQQQAILSSMIALENRRNDLIQKGELPQKHSSPRSTDVEYLSSLRLVALPDIQGPYMRDHRPVTAHLAREVFHDLVYKNEETAEDVATEKEKGDRGKDDESQGQVLVEVEGGRNREKEEEEQGEKEPTKAGELDSSPTATTTDKLSSSSSSSLPEVPPHRRIIVVEAAHVHPHYFTRLAAAAGPDSHVVIVDARLESLQQHLQGVQSVLRRANRTEHTSSSRASHNSGGSVEMATVSAPCRRRSLLTLTRFSFVRGHIYFVLAELCPRGSVELIVEAMPKTWSAARSSYKRTVTRDYLCMAHAALRPRHREDEASGVLIWTDDAALYRFMMEQLDESKLLVPWAKKNPRVFAKYLPNPLFADAGGAATGKLRGQEDDNAGDSYYYYQRNDEDASVIPSPQLHFIACSKKGATPVPVDNSMVRDYAYERRRYRPLS